MVLPPPFSLHHGKGMAWAGLILQSEPPNKEDILSRTAANLQLMTYYVSENQLLQFICIRTHWYRGLKVKTLIHRLPAAGGGPTGWPLCHCVGQWIISGSECCNCFFLFSSFVEYSCKAWRCSKIWCVWGDKHGSECQLAVNRTERKRERSLTLGSPAPDVLLCESNKCTLVVFHKAYLQTYGHSYINSICMLYVLCCQTHFLLLFCFRDRSHSIAHARMQ